MQHNTRKARERKRGPTRPPIPYRPSTSYTSDSSQSVESFSFIPWIYSDACVHTEAEPQSLPSPQPHIHLPKTPSPPAPEPSEPSPPPPLFEKIFNDLKDEDDLNTLTLMLSLEPTISKLNPDIDAHAMVTAATVIISYCGENAFHSTSSAAKQSQIKKHKEPEAKKKTRKPKVQHTPILSTDPDTWPGYNNNEYNDASDNVSIPTIAVRNHPHFERSIPITAVPSFRPQLVTTASFVPQIQQQRQSHIQQQQRRSHIQQPQCTFVPHVQTQTHRRQQRVPPQTQAQPQMYPMYGNQMLVNGYNANGNIYNANTLNNMQQRRYYNNYSINQNMNVNAMKIQYNMAPPDYIYVS